ncbi:US12 family protein [Undibacterium sp. LX40W]|uniref:US12 family protein n=1 Tax=Undibacterium nitidum TaxID=2762298 RepID=A0A923HVB5_9BURK|nr:MULTISPECIES: Bax inhibitor-1 family protein [Undibacterium]MBC3881994.1 US12 family protein [Undibacterium nitidum]MBC3892010.1 US12 family protein [Undibacterium sp. LX40W]
MEIASAQEGFSPSREKFIGRTFNHLGAAIVGFTLIECALFMSGIAESMARAMFALPWLAILGAFMLVGWLATRTAHSATSKGAQYAALAAYVVAEALLFVPILFIANSVAPGMITNAAVVTLVATGGLIAVAYTSRKDFSFLGSVLKWGGILALVLIVCGAIFGFQLGLFFSVAMVGLAGAAILYDASNIFHHYDEDRYVGAALELFASIAMMFWYVLRIFMSRD